MLSQEVEEKLAEILVDRIEKVNEYILKEIGKTIKQISTLKPTDAYRLGQLIKYGGSYEKIVKELAKVTNVNKNDIQKIFEEVAKNNKQFAKDFYKYRGIDYIPYSKDEALKQQVDSIAKMTQETYLNLSRTTGLGYLSKNIDGDLVFRTIEQNYYDIIDKAIISVAQGKTTFQEEMRKALKIMGHNGLVQYESGRIRRFDSAVRMNILDGIRQLNIETTKAIGKEIDADGVEISVHEAPAPDHADIQGRQFSNEQYIILESGGVATDYKGKKYDGADRREIGQYNCYHKIFNIILGVNEPEYTDEQLEKIKQDNEKGFDFEGKHYSMYEGTQLQRRLELDIRKNKDTQVLARASGLTELAEQSQAKINNLTKRYNELCKVSGLKPKKERMAVSGYKRMKITEVKEPAKPIEKKAITNKISIDQEYADLEKKLKSKGVNLVDISQMPDKELRNDQLRQLDLLTDKYDFSKNGSPNTLNLEYKSLGPYTYADANLYVNRIRLNTKYFNDKQQLIKSEKADGDSGWHYNVEGDKNAIYSITHEYGHIVEYNYYRKTLKDSGWKIGRDKADSMLRDELLTKAMKKLNQKVTRTRFKQVSFSRYGLSKLHDEWFAETFANYVLNGPVDEWTETFGEWLEDYFK